MSWTHCVETRLTFEFLLVYLLYCGLYGELLFCSLGDEYLPELFLWNKKKINKTLISITTCRKKTQSMITSWVQLLLNRLGLGGVHWYGDPLGRGPPNLGEPKPPRPPRPCWGPGIGWGLLSYTRTSLNPSVGTGGGAAGGGVSTFFDASTVVVVEVVVFAADVFLDLINGDLYFEAMSAAGVLTSGQVFGIPSKPANTARFENTYVRLCCYEIWMFMMVIRNAVPWRYHFRNCDNTFCVDIIFADHHHHHHQLQITCLGPCRCRKINK